MVVAGRTAPWFLSARHSVLQRAVLTSVAMGMLGALAGAIGAGAFISISLIAPTNLSQMQMVLLFGSTFVPGLSVAAMIHWNWQGAAATEIALRTLLLIFAAELPVMAVLALFNAEEFQQAMDAGNALISGVLGDWDELPVEIFLLFVLCWLGLSAANLGRCRTWFASTIGSALSLPLAFPILHGVTRIGEGIGNSSELAGILCFLMFLGQMMALLFIPWGLPWWFPPQRAVPDPSGALSPQ